MSVRLTIVFVGCLYHGHMTIHKKYEGCEARPTKSPLTAAEMIILSISVCNFASVFTS